MSNSKQFQDTKEKSGEYSERLIKTWGFDPTTLETNDEYTRGFAQVPNIVHRYLPGLTNNDANLEKLMLYLISRDFDGKGNLVLVDRVKVPSPNSNQYDHHKKNKNYQHRQCW